MHSSFRCLFLWFALACAGCATASSRPDPASTLTEHLRAVSARDLPALVATLTEDEALDLYLPSGERTQTRAEFIALHQRWFAETGWTIQFEPVSTIVARDLAVVTLRSRYSEQTSSSENWVTLVFRYESAGWRLVHDQNMRIQTSPESQ